ncbi:MAG: hypothetical protein JXR36_00830 [Bacteroidales bacterium]|nr:hypothetical protein [Bacteroidales bacterium]
MKKYLLFVFLFWSIILFAQEKSPTSILFLGNSYTYYNNGVDQVLKQIAQSKGDEIEVLSNSPGGYWLEHHCSNATSLSYIQSRDWDYVVIQEQSQKPAFPPAQVEAETYPYAEILCDSIKNNSLCTTPVFFMTWGRENGDASNCASYPPLCTYEGMQWRLRQSYVEMAELNEGIVSPVGMVWKWIRENYPEIDLYQSDESHPTHNGTYLAACTFYASMFHKSPVGADFPDEVDATTAAILQTAAWNVVIDSLDIWQIDTTTHSADFEMLYLVKNVEANINNLSINADSCYWEFGDETSEWQYPDDNQQFGIISHNFPAEGLYEICLTAYKNCEPKKICRDEFVVVSGISQNNNSKNEIRINTASPDFISISNCNGKAFSLVSIDGKIVLKSVIDNNIIDISTIKSGIYILIIGNKSFKIVI